MLELKNIKKDYPAGENTVHALKGISLQFRHAELVSVLGPSGCGKTTLLNIIGGLDQYTEGDLCITGKSTKNFKDRDWDAYRNHSIGFVFQSYNLIQHQTVLQNVELALTLSGVSKKERRQRAKKALEEVGLGNQLHKKPTEMSGGQMQRVAIARALVNNPEIILADEPTGALDTQTSVQVMDILKEVSKDRLVIMVTHNPDLAEKYSTRIIRMLDGELLNDSKPLTPEEIKAEEELDKKTDIASKKKLPSMSFGTSFGLSTKNLITKKSRTALTSFAGSIGIIGIALVLSISQGFSTYINTIQEETLSSYPITIEKSTTDLSTLMETFMGVGSEDVTHDLNAVYQKSALYEMADAFSNLETTENDLKSFKTYIEDSRSDSENSLSTAISGVQFGYDLDMLVYTEDPSGNIVYSDTEELLQDLLMEYMDLDMSSMLSAQNSLLGTDSMSMMSSMGGSTELWQEMLPGDNGQPISDVVENQYDVVYGSWPNSYNEVVLVLDENNELDDMSLYALGLEDRDTIENIMSAAVDGTELERDDKTWSYEEICNKEYKIILNSSCYTYDESTGTYTDLRDTDAGLKYLYDDAIPLKVTGIIRPKEDVTSTILSGSIAYTSMLTDYVVDEMHSSEVIQEQMDNPDRDILTGLPFNENTSNLTDSEKESAFREYIDSLEDAQKATTYVSIMSVPTTDVLNESVEQAMKNVTRADMEETMKQVLMEQMSMSEDEVTSYLEETSDEDLKDYYQMMVEQQVKTQYAQQAQEQLKNLSQDQLVAALDQALDTFTTEDCALYYDNVLEFSESTYEDNLSQLGYVDLDDPAQINIYAATFEDKDTISDAITDYNSDKDELEQITYTDYVGIMMSSITTIINTITYVLIAFVAISLIVSSIMIGVITLISVQERTKEIGILRSIGASKSNVCGMFNAETVVIGLISGVLGVVVTYLLCIPINLIVHKLTGINNLSAVLPPVAAVILIAISVLLTLLAGLIPSRSAAKKDPVVALRTE